MPCQPSLSCSPGLGIYRRKIMQSLGNSRHSRRYTSSRSRSLANRGPRAEMLEKRVLFTTNFWNAAVNGDYTDGSKWSLGHMPTASENAAITLSGTYTVKLTNAAASAKSILVGGGSGTQTLLIQV